MKNKRAAHERAIRSFLKYLSERTQSFVLKGETALFVCYGLDRFSEDIDLDAAGSGDLEEVVKEFCERNGFSYRTAKDTYTVKRYMINYGSSEKPLKVEASYRRKEIASSEVVKVNDVNVYTIESLCILKTNAYAGRDRIRDLYDLAFICRRYYEQLSDKTIELMRSAIEYKGIEHFDYIVREQHDELIDEGKLASDFLAMFDKLGLLYDNKEKSIIVAIENNEIKKESAKKIRKANTENGIYNGAIVNVSNDGEITQRLGNVGNSFVVHELKNVKDDFLKEVKEGRSVAFVYKNGKASVRSREENELENER